MSDAALAKPTRGADASGRPARANLLAMPRAELVRFFAELGEKPFRATQVMRWIHHRRVTEFAEMTDLSKTLRARLERVAEVRPPALVDEHVSDDGTRKWAVAVGGGNHVEAVFIPERERGTLCISSQVGCALDCSFCATGKQGFNRNLTPAEVLGQVWQAAHRLEGTDFGRDKAITNVVLMGMGEPLLNFDGVVPAIDVLLDDLGYGVSKRRLTLSTAGVVPALYRLAEVTDVALAVSLHAANDALRDELVPINRKYPIAELLDACEHYLAGLGERRSITFEYTLLRGVNDTAAHARELGDLLERMRGGCKINLIPFNPFPGSGYVRPEAERVRAFQECLMARGFATMVRTTRGDDIDAACGQLAGAFADRTHRRERYIARLRDSGSATTAVS